jgi:hypothetical protein
MRRADLQILFLWIVDLVLNPALECSVVARAGGQTKDRDGPKSG